jgi:hypothetical protein
MKGNFSALGVKRIREKPKNDPPYYTARFLNIKPALSRAQELFFHARPINHYYCQTDAFWFIALFKPLGNSAEHYIHF